MPKSVGAILAAGSASRFGGPKQLAQLGGRSLIDIALSVLTESRVDAIGVVLGCYESEIRQHLQNRSNRRHIHLIQNEQWQEGIASSIRAAVEYAQSESATHLLLMTCDQPYVTTELLQQLCQALTRESEADTVVASRYANSLGIPAVFPAKIFPQLSALTGDKGAKSIIQATENAIGVEFPQGIIDVDTPIALSEISSL